MTRLAIILVTYNRADFVDKCIASITRAATPDLHIRIIVMDNGSTDGAVEVLARVKESMPPNTVLDIHRTEDNRHVPSTYNRGFRLAWDEPCDYAMMMNDDTEFTEGSLERLLAAAAANPTGMITPLQLNYRAPEHIDANWLRLVKRVDALVEDAVLGRTLRETYELETISGAAMIARANVWRAIGEWDETFWFYGVDDDICTRAKYLGYTNLLVPQSHLLHAHGKLGARPAEQNKEGQQRKWRNETQARYWFCLKDPSVPFWRAFLRLKWIAARNSIECLFHLWPWGAWQSIVIFLWFVPRLPRLAQVRRAHFDPRTRSSMA
jgi:GT2 family glycosyltransferase